MGAATDTKARADTVVAAEGFLPRFFA